MSKFKTLEEAQKAFDALEAENQESVEIITDLKEKLAAKTKEASSPVKEVFVTSDKKKYKVTIPTFRHNGVVVTAAELSKNAELIKELIEMESEILSEVE